jgi:hypothetical protein
VIEETRLGVASVFGVESCPLAAAVGVDAVPWTVNPSSVGVGRALSSQQRLDHTTDLVKINGRSEALRVEVN